MDGGGVGGWQSRSVVVGGKFDQRTPPVIRLPSLLSSSSPLPSPSPLLVSVAPTVFVAIPLSSQLAAPVASRPASYIPSNSTDQGLLLNAEN
ncbi:hypothetical protein R6Q57_020513 [Mikania cordata]